MVTRAIVPRRLDRSGVTMGVTSGVTHNGTQTEVVVYQKQRGWCTTPPFIFALSLFVFFILARRSRTAPAESRDSSLETRAGRDPGRGFLVLSAS